MIMTIEEKRKRREANRAINSKKEAVSPFMKFARKYRGAFIVNSPELKAQLINADLL